MTNTKTQNSHRVPVYRRPIFIVVCLLIIAGIVALILFCVSHLSEENNSSVPQPDSSVENNPSAPSASAPDDSNSNPEAPAGPPQYEGEDPNTMSTLTGRIAYRDLSDHQLTIMVSIDQYLTADGNCKLQLIRDGSAIVNVSRPATADVTTSVCGPFEISTADLAAGSYELNIVITSDDKTGLIKDNIEIE